MKQVIEYYEELANTKYIKGKLYVDRQTNSILLCTSNSAKLIGFDIKTGEFSENWATDHFKLFRGKVTLEQE